MWGIFMKNFLMIFEMAYLKNILFLCLIGLCQCLPNYYRASKSIVGTETKKTYRPVILIPGLLANENTLSNVQQLIEQEHPGTLVYIPRVALGFSSLDDIWKQVSSYYNAIQKVVNPTDEINLLAFSQGGLIARGLIEKMGLKVRNFIALSSPLAGQYGDYALDFLLNTTKHEAYKKLYLDVFMQEYSVAQYWNDPHHQDLYLKYCRYLPVINNEVEPRNKTFADNFKSLNKLILIGGPDDGIISPWQSSHFSFYDENENIINFRDREIYRKDLFGLKTLDELEKIEVYTLAGVNHYQWHVDEYILRNYVLPWLD